MNRETPLNPHRCCLNLRHKLMYCDARQATPGTVDASSDTRVYLCMVSQEVVGPDGGPVNPGACAGGRPCHRAAPGDPGAGQRG